MQHIHLKTLTLVSGLSLALCASPAWSAQACKSDKSATTPSGDFTAHGDGTVTHHKTGLMWKVCSEGQTFAMSGGTPTCTGTPSTYNWKDALAQAESVNFAGKSDWRLPNINELKSIAELKCTNPAINASVFPSTPSSVYWSSSPAADDNDDAWGVFFDDGHDNYGYKSNSAGARLVRAQ